MSVTFECVKARQKNLDYFETSMTFASIDNHVKLPDDQRWNHIFEDAEDAQRKLNKSRVDNEMVPYLTDNDNSFFSTLTLILVPRDGTMLDPERDYTFKPVDGHKKIGILELEDSVLLFPADGQHRAAAIKAALLKDPSLANEEVGVNLIPYMGKDEMRQLFSDLNLYAKTPSKTLGLAFDTRDPLSILSKRVMEEVKLFKGRVNEKTNSLSAKSPDVITMNTLVDSNRSLVGALTASGMLSEDDLKVIRSKRPSDQAVGRVAYPVVDVWQTIIDNTPGWADVFGGADTAGGAREKYVSAFGLGWRAATEVAAALIKDHPETWRADLKHALGSVNWAKGEDWRGIAMVGERVNNTGPGIRATAGYVLDSADFDSVGENMNSLIETYRKSVSGFTKASASQTA